MNRADDWSGLTDAGDGTGSAAGRETKGAGTAREKKAAGRSPRKSRAGRTGRASAAPRQRPSADEAPSALTPDAEAWLASAGPPPDWAQDIVAEHSAAVASTETARRRTPGERDEEPGLPEARPERTSSARIRSAPSRDSLSAASADEEPGEFLDSGTDEPPARRRKDSRAGRTEGPRGGAETRDVPEEARAIVLRQLTGSAKSRQQLADKLADREIPDDVAEQVLDRFEELGLVDDREFALMWVRSRAQTRRLAASALRRELIQKGIDAEHIEEALEQVSEDDERRAARELVDKKLRTQRTADLEDRQGRDKVKRRLVSMLARKGYGGGIAFGVVNEAVQEALDEAR